MLLNRIVANPHETSLPVYDFYWEEQFISQNQVDDVRLKEILEDCRKAGDTDKQTLDRTKKNKKNEPRK
jgi:hypothetical protein